MINWLRNRLLFTVIVVIPTVAAIIYYGLIASDIYVSESRFLVRSPQQQAQTQGVFGALLSGTGISHAQDDTYAVRDYMVSRDAVRELQSRLNVEQRFSTQKADLINRFPGVAFDRSFEEFFLYFTKHVTTVEYEATTGITTLTVRAFDAEDARLINATLIEMAERLVNTLNERSRNDTVRFAEHEVQLASDKAKEASVALLSYRSQQSVFEPDKQAALQLEGVAKIQQELIATEAGIAELRKLSPDNPQLGGLNSRAESLRSAIASEAGKVTGVKGSFSARAPDFERLALDVEFADKQLGIALAGLEGARTEAERQQLYLERLVQPNLPDKAMEPRRLRTIFGLFVMSLVIWAVASVMVASVREHAD